VLGLVIALRPHREPGDRRVGLVTAGLAALWFVAATQLLLPTVAGHPAHYEALYQGVGGSPSGILDTAIHDPGEITARFVTSESGEFAGKLLAPFGLTALLAPALLLLGLPQFGIDIVSDASWTRAIMYHYAAIPLAAVAISAVEGVAFVVRRVGGATRWLLPAFVLACAIASTLAWGPSPVGAEYDNNWWPPASDSRLDAKRAATAAIPDDASVSAVYTFVPHLSRREHIYTFPNPWRASNWGYQDRETDDPRDVDWLAIDRLALGPEDAALLDRILSNGNWVVVQRSNDVLVARRKGA
jgi:hypothetical protein